MQINIRLTGIEEALKMADSRKVDWAAVRAINRIVTPAKNNAIREIKKTYNLPPIQRVNDAIRVGRARYGNPSAYIVTRGRSPGLQHNVKGRQTRTGVTVLVRKDRGPKKFRHGFLAPGADGKGRGLWHREGEKVIPTRGRYEGRMTRDGRPIKRQPIIRHFGPGIVGMMRVIGVRKIEERINERWAREFSHELDWEMRK